MVCNNTSLMFTIVAPNYSLQKRITCSKRNWDSSVSIVTNLQGGQLVGQTSLHSTAF